MVRLSDIIENETYMPNGFGLIVFGELASKCLEEDDAENKLWKAYARNESYLMTIGSLN